MTTSDHRTGFLPSARTQIDLAILQAAVANKVARHQAALGVDEARAVDHATTVAAVTVGWWLFVLAPTVLVIGLAPLGDLHPLMMLWETGIVATVTMQRIRLSEWRDRPVGVPGASPSGWWFALGGAAWAYGFPVSIGVVRVLL